MRQRLFRFTLFSVLPLAGCHSHYVETTITNTTAAKLSVVQVEYPSASFGVQALAPGESFHYRFKVYGSGPVKLTYFDAAAHEHHQQGPVLTEGQEGELTLSFVSQDHVDFHTRLKP